jgi:peptide/nickel transport system substrate-binding protein
MHRGGPFPAESVRERDNSDALNRRRHVPRAAGWLRVCLVAAFACLDITACQRPVVPSEDVTLRVGAGVGLTDFDRVQAMEVLTELLFAEPLWTLDWDGRPALRLIDGWTWDDDGRALRLHLRPGVTFHDGRPLTPAVVVGILRQNIDRLRTRAKTRRYTYVGGFKEVAHVEASGDNGVVIHLWKPDALLVDALNGTMMVDTAAPDIGTGPFRIVARSPVVIVEKHAAYYGGAPAIDRVEVKTYDSQRSAWAAMMRGDVDVLQEVARESVEFLKGASAIETYSSVRPFYIPLVFNIRHPVLGRVEVRRALSEAINREEIVKSAMRGHGRVADDPIWPYHWAYSGAARRYSFNPDAAGLRLDAAGLPIQDSRQGDRMASRLRFTCLFMEEYPQFERIALLLQRQLSRVGVDLALERLPLIQLSRRLSSGDFDSYIMPTSSGRSFEWLYRRWHSPEGQQAEFQDSGYRGADTILEHLRTVRSESEIRLAVGDLQQRFYEDAPAVFLAWQETTRAVSARFDVGKPTDPDIYANLWTWRVAPPDQRAAK